VTNKPGWLTQPLLKALGLWCRASCVLSGDSLEVRKPHPLPLLEAARRSGVDPTQCIYVGDAERDIAAGRAAGMLTLVARYGYFGADEPIADWRADGAIDSLAEVAPWVDDWSRARSRDAR
ncbi:MAG: HAD-IA family hydrolase, partial [Pseudomonadota bacterium]